MQSLSQKALAVVATYNERENLPGLIEQFLALSEPLDLLVVDDNSPDGTGELAEVFARRYPNIQVLHRPQKEGLAPALVEGFRWGLIQDYDLILNLDGDLSHNPNAIPSLLSEAACADLVLGSRYIRGIRVMNWPPRRLFLSLSAARYVQVMTGMPFADPTSGFRCFRREALQTALSPPILSRGYSFHIECVHKVWRRGMRIREVPIIFTDRLNGSTKINAMIVGEALWIAWLLLLHNRARRVPACGEPTHGVYGTVH